MSSVSLIFCITAAESLVLTLPSCNLFSMSFTSISESLEASIWKVSASSFQLYISQFDANIPSLTSGCLVKFTMECRVWPMILFSCGRCRFSGIFSYSTHPFPAAPAPSFPRSANMFKALSVSSEAFSLLKKPVIPHIFCSR
ncbi:MAG: hypothetical protein A4E23_00449 [Methanomethylovorans sp. PtaU1.Bin073]|nr:MAG: hypothetical protein A4E23_00449 [Methanomethylovorans sp. PtaU1.Bin073]